MKKISLYLIFGLFMVVCSYIAYGAIACTTSADDGTTIIGISSFNATITGVTAGDYNATTPVLYGKCTNTANSSYTVLINSTDTAIWSNGTDATGGLTLNTTYNSVGMEDDTSCTFYMVISNYTNSSQNQGNNEVTCTATSTSVIDNTKPDTPSSLSPADKAESTTDNTTLSATVNGTETTGCTLVFGRSNYSMTHSGSSCTYSMSNIGAGDYQWYVVASDGTNVTRSSTYTAVFIYKGGTGKTVTTPAEKDTQITIGGETLTELGSKVGVEDVKEWAKKETTKPELIKTGIGAVTGGVIGTMLFPGVGTIGGVAIGGLIGVLI